MIEESMRPGPSQPGTVAAADAAGDPLADPRALQILSTEHYSLMAARSLAYNEAFSRASMFLSFLSATLIVIGFLIGTQGLSATVVPIAAVLLLADLYVGAATVGRLSAASGEELQAIRGMNRIRHAYLEMVPGLEPYFTTGSHDDARGVLATYGMAARTGNLQNVLHGLTTALAVVATIDAMILGALLTIVTLGLNVDLPVGLLVGLVGFLLANIAFALLGSRVALARQARAESRFPTPPG